MENEYLQTNHTPDMERKYRTTLRAARANVMMSTYFDKLIQLFLIVFLAYTAIYNEFFPGYSWIAFLFGGIVFVNLNYFIVFLIREISIYKNITDHVNPAIYMTDACYEDKDGNLWKIVEVVGTWKRSGGRVYNVKRVEDDKETYFYYEEELFFDKKLDPMKIIEDKEQEWDILKKMNY